MYTPLPVIQVHKQPMPCTQMLLSIPSCQSSNKTAPQHYHSTAFRTGLLEATH